MSNYWLKEELEQKMSEVMKSYLFRPMTFALKREIETELRNKFNVIVKVNYGTDGMIDIRYWEEKNDRPNR